MSAIGIAAIAGTLGACDRPPSASPIPAPTVAPTSSPATTAAPVSVVPRASLEGGVVQLAAAPPSMAATVSFDADALGGPAAELEPVIGAWYVAEDGGQRGLRVDGAKWQQGTASDALVAQAERLYGPKGPEFVGGVKGAASFPLAIWTREPPKGDLGISVRFYPEAGKIDQGAGIVFGVAADGSYWGVRANALEGNLLFFHVVRGQRTVLGDVREVPTPSKTWHTLALEIHGRRILAMVDGEKRLEKTLTATPAGLVGLWSKADSQVLFDDFTVIPLPAVSP
jgi:hypothetical protein